MFSAAAETDSGFAVDKPFIRCYNTFDNLITHCVAGAALKLHLLNKITGCESRTVPPLYVPMVLIFDESQSLGIPGKAISIAATQSCKARVRRPTLWILPLSACYGEVRLSQKNGCGTYHRCRSFRILGGKIMKKTTKKLVSVLLAVLLLLSMTACRNEPLVIKDSDTYIVIKTTQEAIGDKTDMLLIDYMETLKQKGELEFSVGNGMILSINGIDNPADYSSCWMLYTSDAENANASWGTVEYEGKEYGSAVSGAEVLKIKPDQLYIWVFKSFS